jgi:hypothetical protein
MAKKSNCSSRNLACAAGERISGGSGTVPVAAKRSTITGQNPVLSIVGTATVPDVSDGGCA